MIIWFIGTTLALCAFHWLSSIMPSTRCKAYSHQAPTITWHSSPHDPLYVTPSICLIATKRISWLLWPAAFSANMHQQHSPHPVKRVGNRCISAKRRLGLWRFLGNDDLQIRNASSHPGRRQPHRTMGKCMGNKCNDGSCSWRPRAYPRRLRHLGAPHVPRQVLLAMLLKGWQQGHGSDQPPWKYWSLMNQITHDESPCRPCIKMLSQHWGHAQLHLEYLDVIKSLRAKLDREQLWRPIAAHAFRNI